MPVKIFASYVLEDKALIHSLQSHIGSLWRQGLIEAWYDREIIAGAEWGREIDKQLDTADIILLFISADFIASDYIYSIEMQRAIERHERGEARVIPIIVRAVYWEYAPFAKLQVLPTDAKPIRSWHNQEEAFFNVIDGIRKTIAELLAIEFSIEQGDITSFNADVVALKYAQEFFGVDALIARNLGTVGIAEANLRPAIGDYRYVETQHCINAHHALFVGVPDLTKFGYQQIKEFSKQVLDILAKEASSTDHLAMTVHGVGFGLDEIEAFLAQFTGYLEAIQQDKLSPHLRHISIVERNTGRVQRLREELEKYIASTEYASQAKTGGAYLLNRQQLKNTSMAYLQPGLTVSGGIESKAKPHIFVAMPFKEDMDDVFFYGIQKPVRAAGFLCERVDQEAFIGDILDQVKKKIETAAIVIAELSGANPNVYLEVGYAWGKGRLTILLVRNEQELHFDVRGQRCLKYERIQDLEEYLKKELKELKSKGFI